MKHPVSVLHLPLCLILNKCKNVQMSTGIREAMYTVRCMSDCLSRFPVVCAGTKVKRKVIWGFHNKICESCSGKVMFGKTEKKEPVLFQCWHINLLSS